MRAHVFGTFIFVGVAVATGFFVARTSWNGIVYVSPGDFQNSNTRSPAAIRRDLDFSLLNGAELVTASQKRLVTAARTIAHEGEIGIELGHFVTKGPDGRRELACDVYDRIMLRFESEGMAESGDKPVMEIEGPCDTSEDITVISAVWIPVSKITGERPADMDLSFDQGEDAKKVNFRFSHMGTEWPTQWRLQGVRMSDNEGTGPEVSISGAVLREHLKKPIFINWADVQANAPSDSAPVSY